MSLFKKIQKNEQAENVCFSKEKCLLLINEEQKNDFDEKTRAKVKGQLRPPAGRPEIHGTVCVCFCIMNSLKANENLNRSATAVRETST